jgi:NAD(P)-dependent dehydrogenase (short-subunit alcohol dehydrogenase family)
VTNRLKNKTALITGASRGIGLAIAEAYAAEGANLILNARNPDQLNQVAAKLRTDFGVNVTCAPFDVVDRPAIEAMAKTADANGGIDILVNNAGIHRAAPFLAYTPQDFREVFEVNFFGVLHATQCVLPGMIARRRGRIVNLASTAGKWGSRNQSAYNVSKHAVVGLTRCLALEMAPHNIGVNAICPWVVDTDMATSFIAEHAKAAGLTTEQTAANFVAAVPIKRFIQPTEIAQLAVYLGSDESAFVNGQAWTIDGGYTMI